MRKYFIEKNPPNTHSFSSLSYFCSKDGIKYTIPYESEVRDLIKLCHMSKTNHYDVKATVKELKKLRIHWAGMELRVKKKINQCACKKIIVIRSKLPKVVSYKRIISKNSLERFQANTTFLSNEAAGGNGGKIILNVKDHFSKYAWSFLLKKTTLKM
jgi:hypothetical protein